MPAPAPLWFVYMLRCRDNSLYTGITTDLPQRLHEHNHSPKGAKYTRPRRPVHLVYHEKQPSRSAAASREYAIKRLPKTQKEEMVRGYAPRDKNQNSTPLSPSETEKRKDSE